MPTEKDFFRQVMGHFTTGVAIATTKSNGAVAGLTVNAFTSVSLQPPLVLICVDLTSHTISQFRESQTFAVNMLTEQQQHLSRCFALNSQDRYEHFCHASYHTAATGAPIIDDVLAFIDARIVAEYPGGDHVIFLGQVEAMGMQGNIVIMHDEQKAQHTSPEPKSNGATPNDEAPLLYYRGQYRHLATQYQEPSIGEQKIIDNHDKDIEEPTRGR